jgi:hypothetical protein
LRIGWPLERLASFGCVVQLSPLPAGSLAKIRFLGSQNFEHLRRFYPEITGLAAHTERYDGG